MPKKTAWCSYLDSTREPSSRIGIAIGNVNTDMDIYSHLTEKTKRRSADLMDAILGDSTTGLRGTDGGTSATRKALRTTGGPQFVLRKVVGAERFERSTS